MVFFPVAPAGSKRAFASFALVAALVLASCSPRTPTPVASSPDEATGASPSPSRVAAFAAAADRIRPAVVVLESFDPRGRVTAYQHGFFASAAGDLLVPDDAIHDAASAVVKTADECAYDVALTTLRPAGPNFVLLQTNAKNVPYLDLPTIADLTATMNAAVVLSAVSSAQQPLLVGQLTADKRDAEWFNFEPVLPKTSVGAPVIDEKGGLIGVVAQRAGTDAPMIFHPAHGEKLTAAPTSEPAPTVPSAGVQLSGPIEAVAPPGEGPAENKPPVKPAEARPKPATRAARITFSPAPLYPRQLAWTHWKAGGSGRYRVNFNAEGEAAEIEIVRSAGRPALDRAAVTTLRRWRADPGAPSTVIVPVAF